MTNIILDYDELENQFYKNRIFVALYLKENYESKGSF